MKPKHKAGYAFNARQVLASLSVGLGQDFHTLSRDQVAGLLAEADREKYQPPKNANGSRARYFHDKLQRYAQAAKV